MESSIKAFRFASETATENEEEARRNKIVKMALILVLCLLLLTFVLVVIAMTRTSKSESRGPPGKNEEQEPIDLQLLKNCRDAMEILPPPRSKKQTIYPHGNRTSVKVLWDFETDGGGWTIIQKRPGTPSDFHQNWTEYVEGFGSLDGGFWIGLENIRALTQSGDQELRIELEDWEGNKAWAKYSSFSVSDSSDFYRLTIRGYFENSTAGRDIFKNSNNYRFTTQDKDNDRNGDGNCASWYGGGWWFGGCWPHSNLNGIYRNKGATFPSNLGITWRSWKGEDYSLKKTEMKIRKRIP